MEAKAISKKHQKNDVQYEPKLVPKGSQNGAKIIKNEVLEVSCFKGAPKWPPDAHPGSILERFWDHFGAMFRSCLNHFLLIYACAHKQHVANRDVQNHEETSENKKKQAERV